MRLLRRSCVLVVYVRPKELRFPIVVPIPLALLQELLQACRVLAWLWPIGIRGAIRLSKAPRQIQRWRSYLPLEQFPGLLPLRLDTQPRRAVSAAQRSLANLRALGPVRLVDVSTAEARVMVRLI